MSGHVRLTPAPKYLYRYLFSAPLLFSFFSFFHIPEDGSTTIGGLESPASFLISYLIGSLIAYLLSLLPFARKRRRPSSLFLVLPAIVGLSLVFLFHEAHFGIVYQVPVGAGLIGISSALLFVSWIRAFCLLSRRQASFTIVLSFFTALILYSLFLFVITTALNLVVLGAAIVVSSFPLDTIEGKQSFSARASRAWSLHRVKDFSFRLLEPVFGMVLCCMIWGFTWGNSIQAVPLASQDFEYYALSRNLGGMFACMLLLILIAKSGTDRVFCFLPALAVGLLLANWLIRDLAPPLSLAVTSIIYGGCILILDSILWCKLAELGSEDKDLAWRLIAAVRALLTGVILLSIFITPVLGARGAELATPLFSIAFFVLISAITIRKSAIAPENNRNDGERILRTSSEFSERILCFQNRYDLSERETEVLSFFVRGHSANYIAQHLFISQHTVKTHIKRVYEKAGIHSKDELITLFHADGSAPTDHKYLVL